MKYPCQEVRNKNPSLFRWVVRYQEARHTYPTLVRRQRDATSSILLCWLAWVPQPEAFKTIVFYLTGTAFPARLAVSTVRALDYIPAVWIVGSPKRGNAKEGR